MARGTRWHPIFNVGEAARARSIVLRIADTIANDSRDQPVGDEMRPLLDAYIARALESERHLDRAFERLNTQFGRPRPALQYGLFTGIAGLGWVATHTRALLADWLKPTKDDPCKPIDDVLIQIVRRYPPKSHYDLISGLAGTAVYALERVSRRQAKQLLAGVIDRLAADAEVTEDGIRWFTSPRLLPEHQRRIAPNGYYNLGVAHGVPAVALVLARAIRADISPDIARPLLERSINWIMAQQNPVGFGSKFPAWIPKRPANVPLDSREAWCYGGLGLSVSLLAAARTVGHRDFEEMALGFARLEASREFEQSGVVDMCLCHGGAGNGHLYNRLYQATGELVFYEAACKWLRAALAAHDPMSDGCGYLFHVSRDKKPVPDFSFLSGSAGVALALLAASTELEPNWDRVMMADLTPTLLPSQGPR